MTSDTHVGPIEGRWLRTGPGVPCLVGVSAAEANGACSVVEILLHPGHSTQMHVPQVEQGQRVAVRPAARLIAGSSLVRRLIRAKDDPAKQRIRTWLSEIGDERLLCFGLTSQDIAMLRGRQIPEASKQ